ncbi:2415_t:CDS:2, partial [Acaulospora colombiana]
MEASREKAQTGPPGVRVVALPTAAQPSTSVHPIHSAVFVHQTARVYNSFRLLRGLSSVLRTSNRNVVPPFGLGSNSPNSTIFAHLLPQSPKRLDSVSSSGSCCDSTP